MISGYNSVSAINFWENIQRIKAQGINLEMFPVRVLKCVNVIEVPCCISDSAMFHVLLSYLFISIACEGTDYSYETHKRNNLHCFIFGEWCWMSYINIKRKKWIATGM